MKTAGIIFNPEKKRAVDEMKKFRAILADFSPFWEPI